MRNLKITDSRERYQGSHFKVVPNHKKTEKAGGDFEFFRTAGTKGAFGYFCRPGQK